MLLGIDHLVILVRDLAQATADYTSVGFVVTPGGTHADGATHNALVSFADGTYLELIAFVEPDRPQAHPWWPRLAKGEGLVDFALRSDDLAADADRWRAQGLPVQGPQDGGRTRPDGQELRWRTVRFGAPSVLPFVIQDVTPRELRVPGEDATAHPIGVTGIAGLTVAVEALAPAVQAYTALLGAPVPMLLTGVECFALGSDWIAVATLAADDTGAMAPALARFGPAPFAVALKAEVPLPADAFADLARTHGARFAPAE
jgi:catechol 2,3-dioxygenase-like lactoylglutathione lyase family enzyme